MPFREDESFVDRLARANAALGRAIHAQLPAWDVKRNEIAVFGPQREHRNGSVSYVYRLVEDRKPLFGKGKGAETGAHEARDMESATGIRSAVGWRKVE